MNELKNDLSSFDRILIVTSKTISHKSFFKNILNIIKVKSIVLIGAEPRLDDIYAQVDFKKFDLILAIGGGSVIDSAKIINMIIANKLNIDFSIDEFKNKIPLYVITTRIGSGSEFNKHSVITITNQKKAFSHDLLYPDVVFLDTNLIYKDKNVLYCGISDIIVHLLERYISKISFSITSEFLVILLKRLIVLVNLVENEKIMQNDLKEIMWINSLGNSDIINIGQKADWSSHRIAHVIGSSYHLNHCKIIGIVAYYWLKLLSKKDDEVNLLIDKVFGNLDKYKKILNKLDLFNKLNDENIDYEYLFNEIVKDMKSKTIGNFERLDKNDILYILKKVFNG